MIILVVKGMTVIANDYSSGEKYDSVIANDCSLVERYDSVIANASRKNTCTELF